MHAVRAVGIAAVVAVFALAGCFDPLGSPNALQVTLDAENYGYEATFSFGAVDPDSGPVEVSGQLTNVVGTDITVQSYGTEAPFSVEAPQAPFTVAAEESISVSLSFDPDAFGPATGTLEIVLDGPANPFILNLTGSGDSAPVAREAVVVTGAGSAEADGVYYRNGELNSWPYFERVAESGTWYRIYAEMVEGPEWYLDRASEVWITMYYVDYFDSPGDTGPSTVPGIPWQVAGGTSPAPTSVGPFTMDRPGWPEAGDVIVASYVYEDAESDEEGASAYQWYRSDESDPDSTYSPIDGATGTSYMATFADVDLFLKFQVIPHAATGTEIGEALMMGPTPPIAMPPIMD